MAEINEVETSLEKYLSIENQNNDYLATYYVGDDEVRQILSKLRAWFKIKMF